MRFMWLVLLLIPQLSLAEVLTTKVPRAEPSRILAVVAQAFEGREWTVEDVGTESVTASINHNRTFVRMKVSLMNGQLVYDLSDMTRKAAITNPAQSAPVSVGRPSPDRWVKAIRKDVERSLVLLPELAS
jgi:hypothetical protein